MGSPGWIAPALHAAGLAAAPCPGRKTHLIEKNHLFWGDSASGFQRQDRPDAAYLLFAVVKDGRLFEGGQGGLGRGGEDV